MKKKLIIILPITLIIIISIILIVLYFSTNIFKSAKQLFWNAIVKNNEILNVFENENDKEQEEIKKVNNYTANGILNITIEKNEDKKNINIITNTSHQAETGGTYSKATLKNGETDLLKLFYINSNNVYAIKSEELLKYYIGIRNSDLKGFAKKLGMDEKIIQYIPDNINFENILNITDDEKQQILNTYLGIIIQNIPKNNYKKLGKNNIEIEGNNYETEAYSLRLNENEIKSIIIKCLENLKNDNTILEIIKRNNINNFSEIVDNIILNIQNTDLNKSLEIVIYGNKQKNVRTVINISDKIKLTIDNIYEKKVTIALDLENNYKAKITASKTVEENCITNNIEIIPDMSKPTYVYSITTKLGKMQNNNIINSTITTVTNENNLKVSALYNKNIQLGTQIEDITELKNSNSIILNNYTIKQLTPFLGKKVINNFKNITRKLDQTEIKDLTPKIILEIAGTTGVSLINTNGLGNTEKLLSGAFIFITDYAQKSFRINNNFTNTANETETQIMLKKFTSADGTRNISADDVSKIYDVVIENNSIMQEGNFISINNISKVEKLKENKANIDIAKIYEIKIKSYKPNGSISEIIIKENTENFNIMEEIPE